MKYIDLTTDFDPGDLDTIDYAHVAITQYMHIPGGGLDFYSNYGNVAAGEFTPGKTNPIVTHLTGSSYTTLMAVTAVDGDETVRDAMERAMLQYLIDQSVYAGTVV